jgi:uncharacterized protein YndB with AHSA1/START domain
MGAFQISIDIACTPATVFPLVAEPSSMKRWYEAVDDVAITTDGATKRGTTYRIARSLPGGPAINVVEITDYDPDRHVTHESLSGPTPFRYSYTLEPTLGGQRSRSTAASPAPESSAPPRPPTTSPPSSSSAACGRTWPP